MAILVLVAVAILAVVGRCAAPSGSVVGPHRTGGYRVQRPDRAGDPGQCRAGLQTVTVLASVTPYSQATLYAKVSGYLAKVLVDKGDHVKAGQLLATIESQETDAQYNSARPT